MSKCARVYTCFQRKYYRCYYRIESTDVWPFKNDNDFLKTRFGERPLEYELDESHM